MKVTEQREGKQFQTVYFLIWYSRFDSSQNLGILRDFGRVFPYLENANSAKKKIFEIFERLRKFP